MTAQKRRLTLGALTAIAVGIAAAMANGSSGSQNDQDAPMLSVRTAPVTVESVYETQALFPGRVRAGRRSQLGFERGGRLDSVAFDEGDRVAKGTVLARLDQRQLKAQNAAAAAQVSAAKAGLSEAQASKALASAVQERQRTLLEKGHISEQRFDDSTYALRAANAAVSSAKARLLQAKADAEAVSVALALTDLTAPFDGFVVKRMADEGTVLGPGTPIFDFEESGKTEFVSGVPINAASALATGSSFEVTINGEKHSATLSKVVSALDTTTRTAQLVLTLPESAGVASGEVGQLSLNQQMSGDGFWVPMEALQEGARGLWTVFVAKPNGDNTATIERHPVELMYSDLGKAYVRGTPSNGALVVQSGADRLVTGQRVTLAS